MNEIERRAYALRKVPFSITCHDCKNVVNLHNAQEYRAFKECPKCKSTKLSKEHRTIQSL